MLLEVRGKTVFSRRSQGSLQEVGQPVHAINSENWELTNLKVIGSTEDTSIFPATLANMKVKIENGEINCNFTAPVSATRGGTGFNGTMSLELEGDYNSLTGIDGWYTHSYSGTMTIQNKQVPYGGKVRSIIET
jgi:hypothetical protein